MWDVVALAIDLVQILAYPAVWLYNKANAPFELPDLIEFNPDDPNNTFRMDD